MRQPRRTTIITSFLAAILVGLALGQRNVTVPVAIIAVFFVLAILARQSRVLIIILCALGLTIGLWRGQRSLTQYHQLTSHIGTKVTAIGVVADDPAEVNGHVNFNLNHLSINGQPVRGDIAVTSYPLRVKRSQRLQLVGKLGPGFGTKPAAMGYATVTVLSTKLGTLEAWRQAFFAGMHTALPDPLASFGLGLLIGARALIPKVIQGQLNTVGLSHLIAVSGYNLTILTGAAYAILRPRSRFLAAAVSLWLIAGFVVVAGASASITRAALVAVLVLAASWYGRSFKPLVLITLAAAITAFMNPINLTKDVGWQLSFLAFFGIMVVAPAFQQRFVKRDNQLINVATESFAAQLMTFPLILVIFGTFSPIAPLANLIILPLVPFAMLASFVAGLGGVYLAPIAGWLAWPAFLLLQGMLSLISYLSSWSWASITGQMSTTQMAAMYACICAFLLVLAASTRRNQTENAIIKPIVTE